MSLRVLQYYDENRAAREEMRRRRFSYWPQKPSRGLIDRLLLRPALSVGELNKSWDVLAAVRLIEERLPREAAVLDQGAYASEVLCAMHLLSFRNLTGIDLNPAVRSMPFSGEIRYVVGDMNAAPFADGTMAAITSISAIEHGLALRPLLRETARLLAPGGLFIASTDYWPDKIDTSGIRMYGFDWTIFSRDELQALFDVAREFGLAPVGECRFEASEPAIECAGKRFTFAWFALEKRAS